MTKYSSLLKGKLQELLTARGLPIDGTKEVLIERLEESDKIAAELEADDEPATTDVAPPPAESAASAASIEQASEAPVNEAKAETSESASAPAPVAAPVATPVESNKGVQELEPVVPDVTPETLKTAAIEMLNTKIARAQKFGEDSQVSALKGDLARVEKFGVALDSALARELGYASVKKPEHKNSNANRPRHFNNRKHNNNRRRGGFKPNDDSRYHIQQGRVYKTR